MLDEPEAFELQLLNTCEGLIKIVEFLKAVKVEFIVH